MESWPEATGHLEATHRSNSEAFKTERAFKHNPSQLLPFPERKLRSREDRDLLRVAKGINTRAESSLLAPGLGPLPTAALLKQALTLEPLLSDRASACQI
jgi:hypothetical protein